MSHTIVHLLRHGEVHNPHQILYGRLPDFHLSTLGHNMAEVVAEKFFSHRDIRYIMSSPLERAQETAAPTAKALGLEVHLDDRIIEAQNYFEGKKMTPSLLKEREHWKHFMNPFKPSWGESYTAIAVRMYKAIADAVEHAYGAEAVIVSHQLPIWIARLTAEGKRKWHHPNKRHCTLASITSLHYHNGTIEKVEYNQPAHHLLSQVPPTPGA